MLRARESEESEPPSCVWIKTYEVCDLYSHRRIERRLDAGNVERRIRVELREPAVKRILSSIAEATVILCASAAFGQSARDIRGADPVVPLENEPPARIIVDPPLPESLAKGFVFIQYRAENLHIVPVFGPKALDDSPRIGHIHVTVDDAPWHWADASGEPLIIVGLPVGPHKVLIELVDANGGFKSEAQQGANEWKLRLSKRLRAYVRRPRMVNEMHG
jgi:hypothetical protein